MPSPRDHNHYRIFSGNECYANVTRMLRFRNVHFPEIGGQKCISPIWHRAFMHIAATKTETAIFFKDCQSAKTEGQKPETVPGWSELRERTRLVCVAQMQDGRRRLHLRPSEFFGERGRIHLRRRGAGRVPLLRGARAPRGLLIQLKPLRKALFRHTYGVTMSRWRAAIRCPPD